METEVLVYADIAGATRLAGYLWPRVRKCSGQLISDTLIGGLATTCFS